MEFAGILHADVVELKGDCGHLETGCDKDEAAPKVRDSWVNDHRQTKILIQAFGSRFQVQN